MSIDELTANLSASQIKVAELAALNSEFEKENISLTAKIADLEKTGGELSAKVATLEADATAKAEQHTAELAKLNSELDASKKETATLREQSARFGAPAPKAPITKSNEKPILSRKEFNSLPVGERMAFAQKGGKIEE